MWKISDLGLNVPNVDCMEKWWKQTKSVDGQSKSWVRKEKASLGVVTRTGKPDTRVNESPLDPIYLHIKGTNASE